MWQVNKGTDQELLRGFAVDRNEKAFEELIRRHVDLVYSAARRLVVDAHLAEDVTQSVFAALAHDAQKVIRKLDHGAPLSGWLHVTTRNIAAKTVRGEMRRRAREMEAGAMYDDSQFSESSVWEQIAPELDSALAELPEKDRNLLLLRFFEKKSARQIGERLGLTEPTAQKRMARALEGLRAVFVRRGLPVPGVVLGSVLAARAVEAAPVALFQGISKGIFFVKAAATSPVAISGFSKLAASFFMTKTQTTVLVVVVGALMIPLGSQRLELAKIRAEFSSNYATRGTVVHSPDGANPQKEATEIERLRKRAEELRSAIAEKRTKKIFAKGGFDLQAGPFLLANGRKEELKNLVFAGNATAEAALQSIMTLRRDGDIDHLARLMVLPPTEVDEWNKSVASPEMRNELVQGLMEEMRGAVMWESFDGHEVRQGRVEPKDPDVEPVVGIKERHWLDDQRTQFVVEIERGSQKTSNTYILGLTPNGWKQI